ncbi:beta-ketoacyl-ACP synthase II [bacterium]|nr:beta-ketoacyl-ACP synthase II [bacterium]
MKDRRVVITGLGVVTPLGCGVEKFWAALCEGKSGIGRITRFDTKGFDSQIAGEIKDFDPQDFIPQKDIKRMDTFIQYAVAASMMAVKDSGFDIYSFDKDRIGVLIGSGIGGMQAIEKHHSILLEKGPRRISPFFIPMSIINMASGTVSMYFGIKGPNSSVVTACATGTHAIGDAFRIIQRGDADAMIAGGTESVITPLAVAGFCSMKALSTRNDDPAHASRPFDLQRDGFIMGEGAGVIIMEEIGFAMKRNARIYVEIKGYGASSDAYHVSAPDPAAYGAVLCMKRALDDSGISPDEIDYINAHGTSTPLNDKVETMAIKKVFGSHALKLIVSSNKSMTGHLLGAAGGVEVVSSCMTIREGVIPPTINLETPDPECDLDYCPNKARRKKVMRVLKNSFGFGGTNASLVLESPDL